MLPATVPSFKLGLPVFCLEATQTVQGHFCDPYITTIILLSKIYLQENPT